MYLKRLEIKGFKSFADKIDLDFGKGITAIVGPNGSGKSNIADCIRWVLGEQSAKTLRGSKMEDVIFAGTENRKGLGCAEVSLTIDNSSKMFPLDYTEVTVTRRLYKSGESEYFINNTQCRLKDIVELFMDTGIGIDGYSLIGQGKIDEILSTKSEDRRILFEEAAGIVKYKTRKLEAEKKLENTRQNLIRIVDIINELQEQIEPLKEQSAIARRYLTLREELKELEINVILYNYESTKNKLNNCIVEMNSLEESRSEYEHKKEELLISLNELKNLLNGIEKEYEEKNRQRIEIEKNYESLQGNLNLLAERKENLLKEKDRLLNEIDVENKIIMNIQQQFKSIETKKSLIEGEVLKHKQLIDEIAKQYNIISGKCWQYEDLIESKKSDLLQILKNISDLNNKINTSRIMMENLNSRKTQLEKEINIKKERINYLNKDIGDIEKKIKAYEEEIENLKQNARDLHNKIIQLEENDEILKKENNSCFERLKTYEARYKTLSEMDRDMEGFNRAVKAVIARYKDGKSVFGTISDLIEVPRGYETAIEIALGPSIQNIVVDNEDTASKLIEYLKSSGTGRATFLPLTTIKGRELPYDIRNNGIKGYLGAAYDIIKYDLKFKNAVTNLLGRVLICDNLSSARIIARQTDYNYRIVTLDGDVINSGGSFTGGSNSIKSSGVFSRRNEISELSQVIYKEKDNLKKIVDNIYANSQEIFTNKKELDELNKKTMQAVSFIQQENHRIESIKKEISSLEENINDINIELAQIDIEKIKNQEISSTNNSVLNQYMTRQQELEAEISKLQEEHKSSKEKKDEIMNCLTQQKIVFAEKSKSIEAIDLEIERMKRERDGFFQKVENYKKQLRDNDIRCEEVDNEIINTKEAVEKAYEFAISARDDSYKIDMRKKETTNSISLKEEEISNVDESLKDIITSIHKLDIIKSKLESELEVLSNKIWDDYEISIAQAVKYKKNIGGMAEANRRVVNLKNEIKELGDVNVNSIEEYKRVTERFGFLLYQKEDLTKAEQSLVDIIGEIEKKMKEQFEEKFKEIRNNFNQTFKELFGGGYADLKLENDDILNCGIDIIVEPPGKKLQSLSLLSGGERGLAAIALLFAILRMKPTPFCILDEIEAALDDANVNRFARFLKDYSSNTQFIVITHRKGSMAVADALYGVTMEEKGVSKIISLKLKGGN